MFLGRAKIVGFARVMILAACVALWPEAIRSGPVLADEGKETKGPPPALEFPFDIAPAFHFRGVSYFPYAYALAPGRIGGMNVSSVREIHEVWAVQGVGRREETRRGSKLESVIVDTPRCRFSWDVEQNRVVASPAYPEELQAGRLGDFGMLIPPVEVSDREWKFRSSELHTGIAVRQKEVLDGREVDKVITCCPPDSTRSWLNPHSSFDPKRHLEYSGTQFRTRQYWFDPETGRFLGRRCGCKPTHGEYRIDYPAPESLPKELFTFRVPRRAVLEVNDPELRRQLESEGQTGSGPLVGGRFPVGPEAALPQKPKARVGKETDKPRGERWVVMPVTTKLQRIKLGRNARAYVLVDGEGFRRDRVMLDTRALNLDALRRKLEPYSDPDRGIVHFQIRCIWGAPEVVEEGGTFGHGPGWPGEIEKPDHITTVLRYALRGFGREASFLDATSDFLFYRGGTELARNWDALAADLKKQLAEDAGREESGIGGEKFKVYPVRTALSRVMYHNADCVLHVLVESGIGPNEKKAIEESVAKLNLKNKRLLCILDSSGDSMFLKEPTFYKERLGFEESLLFVRR